MNEREALLRAVCENPDDDTPRLVFADWLQENGDEARAELIRVQVEATRGMEWEQRTYFDSYGPRSAELLAEHERRWRAELTDSPGLTWGRFNRGFVDGLGIIMRRGGLPVEYLPFVFELAPLQNLYLGYGGISCETFLSWSVLRHLHWLELYAPGWSEDDWRRVVDCPALRDGLRLGVNVDYPSDETRERMERRFHVAFADS